ncbi:MAG: hypothetical protein KJ737_19520 [Proteobacteria bacterium]|nr:hypothetical protein [Pseudomonadota bacterium]
MEEKQKEIENSDDEVTEFQDFTEYELGNFQEEMISHNWALRAFGALLESADLSHKFGKEWKNSDEYRYGLNMIVEMYIEKQEQEINELGLIYRKSPEHCLKEASRTYESVKQGMFGCSNYALEQVKKHLKKVNLVISELGTENYPQAEKIRDNLLQLAGYITDRLRYKNADVSEKKDIRGLEPGTMEANAAMNQEV